MLRWCTGSPVTVTVTDSAERQTGRTADGGLQQGIPLGGIFAFEDNEGGLLPATQAYAFSLTATKPGVFDLDIDELTTSGQTAVATRFADVPVAAGSLARINVTPGTGGATLRLDVDGDASDDFVLSPGVALSAATSLQILRRVLATLPLPASASASLSSKIDAAVAAAARGNTPAVRAQLKALLGEIRTAVWKRTALDTESGLVDIVQAIVSALPGG
jgi:hypothetical protein